jgi:glycosyltransferase involved in cell wall biosynthesis
VGLAGWLDHHVSEFDLVHVHAVFSHSSLAAGRACRRRGIPYLVRPLGTLDPWSLGRKRFRKRVLYALGVRRLLEGAAVLHYTSADEMTLAESAGAPAGRGVVVPLGIDDRLFDGASGPAGQPPYVLAMSRFDGKKGLDLLIDAFARATRERHRSARLVLAGGGNEADVEELRDRARASGASERIAFAGWVSGVEKAALLRGATVLASPSTQENFGLSVVEAMASGVPVLVTPGVNLAADIAASGGGWVVERHAEAIADALDRALSSTDDHAHRSEAARRFASQFRWSAVSARLIDVYGQAS